VSEANGPPGAREVQEADHVTDELKHSPLDAAHRALGAKLVPFGGWDMPLAYGEGTIAEHLACRNAAVAFDVSHLGTVAVEGEGAGERLQATLTNDLRRIGPGRAQYTHLLDEADASVLDDIIVWWVGDEAFQVMPNASNTSRVVDAIGGRDITAERAVIAVQGPEARRRLAEVAP
jgi:aminomethyltransferase